MFVYLLPSAFSLFCTCPAYNKNEKALVRSLFLFSCSLNRITFCAPYLFRGAWVNDITKNNSTYCKIPPFVQEFFVYSHMSNAAFFQTKQRALERALKEYIFAGAAWSKNSEDQFLQEWSVSLFLLFTSCFCSHVIFGSDLDFVDTLPFRLNSIFFIIWMNSYFLSSIL